MKNKNIFLIATVMLLAAICMSQTTYAQNKDFRAQAGELILKGEFKKTEKLLNGLPKKTKTEKKMVYLFKGRNCNTILYLKCIFLLSGLKECYLLVFPFVDTMKLLTNFLLF